MASATSNRVAVSLRLPAGIAAAVDVYAAEHSLRKTDAYVHFLELGLSAPERISENTALDRLSRQVEKVLTILQGEAKAEEASRDSVITEISAVAEQFPAIKCAYLFGSFARGTQKADSDVDVRLVLDRSKRFNLRDLSRFSKQLEQATRRECDIVTADDITDEELARNIAVDGVLAYERKEQ